MLSVLLNQKANYFHACNVLIITSFTIDIDGKSPAGLLFLNVICSGLLATSPRGT